MPGPAPGVVLCKVALGDTGGRAPGADEAPPPECVSLTSWFDEVEPIAAVHPSGLERPSMKLASCELSTWLAY